MAHELDWKENGTAAMFSVNETPWHQEGELLTKAPSLKEALELGGLNFDVELFPLRTKIPTAGGDFFEIDVPESRAVVRLDRQKSDGVLGVVGPSYHVLQNRDAFAVLEPLLDAGLASLETGGTLRGGRDVWMMVRFNIDDQRVKDVFQNEVVPFGLISNNHNGSRKVVLQETPVRVVCANTLGFALGDLSKAVTVRHTANVKSNMVTAAQELFREFTQRYHIIADQYEAMKLTALTEEQFAQAVLDVIAPLPDAPKGEQKNNIAIAAYDRAKDRAQEKRDRLIFLRDNGIGHTGNGSAWEAYQAVTQSIDHDGNLWKVAGDSRVQALFDGALGKTKQLALESIFSLVKASGAYALTSK